MNVGWTQTALIMNDHSSLLCSIILVKCKNLWLKYKSKYICPKYTSTESRHHW